MTQDEFLATLEITEEELELFIQYMVYNVPDYSESYVESKLEDEDTSDEYYLEDAMEGLWLNVDTEINSTPEKVDPIVVKIYTKIQDLDLGESFHEFLEEDNRIIERYFEYMEEAEGVYEEAKEESDYFNKDPYGYYGVSRSDFF